MWETIYEVIDEKYFDALKVKFPKYFPTKFKSQFNVPRFIPLEVKKKIQQVGLEYLLFLQIVNIKI